MHTLAASVLKYRPWLQGEVADYCSDEKVKALPAMLCVSTLLLKQVWPNCDLFRASLLHSIWCLETYWFLLRFEVDGSGDLTIRCRSGWPTWAKVRSSSSRLFLEKRRSIRWNERQTGRRIGRNVGEFPRRIFWNLHVTCTVWSWFEEF